MDLKSIRILLGLLIAVAAFVAYELAGLDPHTAVNTISFIAQHHIALAIGIEVLILGAGAGLAIWWPHHLRTRIPK